MNFLQSRFPDYRALETSHRSLKEFELSEKSNVNEPLSEDMLNDLLDRLPSILQVCSRNLELIPVSRRTTASQVALVYDLSKSIQICRTVLENEMDENAFEQGARITRLRARGRSSSTLARPHFRMVYDEVVEVEEKTQVVLGNIKVLSAEEETAIERISEDKLRQKSIRTVIYMCIVINLFTMFNIYLARRGRRYYY